MAFHPFCREPVAGANRKKGNCLSTSGATSDELEGAPFTAHMRRPDYLYRQFGWQRGIFRPIWIGRGIFLFACLKDLGTGS